MQKMVNSTLSTKVTGRLETGQSHGMAVQAYPSILMNLSMLCLTFDPLFGACALVWVSNSPRSSFFVRRVLVKLQVSRLCSPFNYSLRALATLVTKL